MRVLVVDDNLTSLEILAETLKSFGFQVGLASSGTEALDILETAPEEHPFEMVLMDWKMAGMDGLETSRRIKQHQRLRRIPTIIMVTAYGREEVMRQADRIGLDGFLIKPVAQSLLFNTILEAFGKEGEKSIRQDSGSSVPETAAVKVRGSSVLLVEDNEINQQVAREILERAGLRVTVASNGEDALELVRKGHFDAVLMDVQMPVMDGFAAAAAIRREERSKDLPIIAMTAHAMAGDREKSLEAGMNDHVTKPIDPMSLIATLEKWIQRRESPDSPSTGMNGDIEPEVMLPDRLEGIDMEEGLMRVGENRHLYRNLLVKFRNNYSDAASRISFFLKSGDIGQARRLVHSIKGVAGNLGAGSLCDIAGDMEVALEHGASERCADVLRDFGRELSKVVQGLKTLTDEEVQGAAAVDSSTANPEETLTLLQELVLAVHARKPKQCEPLVTRMGTIRLPADLEDDGRLLAERIRKYQYKGAMDLLNAMIARVKG